MNKVFISSENHKKTEYLNLSDVEKLIPDELFEQKNNELKELTKQKKQERKLIQQKNSEKLSMLKAERAKLVTDKKPIKNLKLHKSLYPFLRFIMDKNTRISFQKYQIINDSHHKEKRSIKNLYPFLRSIMDKNIKFSLQKYQIINDSCTSLNSKKDLEKRPKIFVVTHIGKYDIEIVKQALNEHSVLLSADEDLLLHNVDGLFLSLNGYIGLDHTDKEDTQNALKIVINTLKAGYNVMIFPEGIWNTNSNQLISPLYFGAISAAMKTGALLKPIAIDQIDNNFKINFGEEIDCRNYFDLTKSKKEIMKEVRLDLRDSLATLKWQIFETNPAIKRSSIPSNYEEQFKYKIFKDYSWFDQEEIDSRVLKEDQHKEETESQEKKKIIKIA